jgi:hypothetical protein
LLASVAGNIVRVRLAVVTPVVRIAGNPVTASADLVFEVVAVALPFGTLPPATTLALAIRCCAENLVGNLSPRAKRLSARGASLAIHG